MGKRLLALLLALVCCFTLLVGCGDGNDSTEETKAKVNRDLENYTTPDLTGADLTIYGFANSDFDAEGSWLDKKVEEKLGFSLTYIELDSWTQQYFTMLAEGSVPDLTFGNGFNTIYFDFGKDGAYLNLYNYLDMMPNVKAFLEDPDNARDVERYTVSEGELYCLPVKTEKDTDPYTFLYRKDIFEKHDLEFPTNQEEFVATLRKLKELYPKSYPFVMRNMTGNMQSIQAFGRLWGDCHVNVGIASTIFTLGEDGTYHMAQISEAYKEMVVFLTSLSDEGLMHPSSATMDTATWNESFASNTSFIGYDKTDRLPSLNKAGQSLREEFLMTAAPAFNFGSHAEETDVVTSGFATGYGGGASIWFAIGNNSNKEYCVAYLDWLYSEEGQIMTNWGVEGESYTVDEEGNKQFIESFLDEHGGLTGAGLYTLSMTGVRLGDAYMAALDENEAASLEIGLMYSENRAAAQHLLHYTEEEQFLYDTYATALFNYAQENWLKFFLKQRDISEWDQVIEEMKAKYHYDDVLAIHESALARVLEQYEGQ